MKKWEKFTDEQLEEIVKKSTSIRDLAINMLKSKNFDISHFTGQAWNKGKFNYDRFKYGNSVKSANAIEAIVALRGHRCEKCNQELWLNEPIPLEVHHLDGDKLNNTLDNLQLLCPNCHALTDNYRGKNINRNVKSNVSEEEFVEALRSTPNIRQALLKLGLTAKGGNYTRAYDLINKYHIIQG